MSEGARADVVVVGGGISGLSTAHYLTGMGHDVLVIEKSARTGGTVETERVDGFLVDRGPNSGLETTPLLGEMFDRTGVRPSLLYAAEDAKNRYIVKNGNLHALPMGPGAFVKTPLFSGRAKLALLREPFVRPGDAEGDESLAEFVQRRLGREFLDYAINPFVSGVYAGVPERLSVRASFPKLYELEQRYGSLIKGTVQGMRERRRRSRSGDQSRASAKMFSFADGMQTLVDALSDSLTDRIATSAEPVAVKRRPGGGLQLHVQGRGTAWDIDADAVVFAIPAYAYNDIRFEFEMTARSALERIPYPPVAVVFFGYNTAPQGAALDGFGFLVPEKEKLSVLGTIWSSTLFPGRAPEGGAALTTFVGGSRQPDNARLDESALVDLVRGDLKDLLGFSASPDMVSVRRWDRAIPQYNVGHSRIIDAIETDEAANPGLYISGNFRGGVSISDCVRQAQAMADRVSAGLGAPVHS